jgi:hypothetical protein
MRKTGWVGCCWTVDADVKGLERMVELSLRPGKQMAGTGGVMASWLLGAERAMPSQHDPDTCRASYGQASYEVLFVCLSVLHADLGRYLANVLADSVEETPG